LIYFSIFLYFGCISPGWAIFDQIASRGEFRGGQKHLVLAFLLLPAFDLPTGFDI
jgi:hypothetical protein